MAVRVTWHAEPPAALPGPARSHFQTVHGARLLRRYGQAPKWLWAAAGDGRALASWLLYTTPSDYLEPPRSRVTRWVDRSLLATHGPVFDPSLAPEEREQVIAVLLGAVAARARRLQPITCSLALEPALPANEIALWRRLAAASGFVTSPSHTYLARLPQTSDELSSQVKRDRRKEVRKAERAGVSFEEVTDLDGVREYAAVRDDTRRRNGQPTVPFEHFAATWETLAGSSIYHIFLARHEGRTAAGQMAFAHEGYVYLAGVAVAQWALDERLPANDFLQWNVLRWALDSGQRVVDFVGAQPQSDDPKIKAIDFFKSRWGTELEESLTLAWNGSRWRARTARVSQRILG